MSVSQVVPVAHSGLPSEAEGTPGRLFNVMSIFNAQQYGVGG